MRDLLGRGRKWEATEHDLFIRLEGRAPAVRELVIVPCWDPVVSAPRRVEREERKKSPPPRGGETIGNTEEP